MKAVFVDKDGKTKPIIMGCYGIGISRLLMAVLEQHYNNDKAVWPKEIRPFDVHLLPLDKKGTPNYQLALDIYEKLKAKGYDVLFDDREESPGVKFKDADLIGINNRVVVGRKAQEGIFEYKKLSDDKVIEVSLEDILNMEY